jgi:hypothetical protein
MDGFSCVHYCLPGGKGFRIKEWLADMTRKNKEIGQEIFSEGRERTVLYSDCAIPYTNLYLC